MDYKRDILELERKERILEILSKQDETDLKELNQTLTSNKFPRVGHCERYFLTYEKELGITVEGELGNKKIYLANKDQVEKVIEKTKNERAEKERHLKSSSNGIDKTKKEVLLFIANNFEGFDIRGLNRNLKEKGLQRIVGIEPYLSNLPEEFGLWEEVIPGERDNFYGCLHPDRIFEYLAKDEEVKNE